VGSLEADHRNQEEVDETPVVACRAYLAYQEEHPLEEEVCHTALVALPEQGASLLVVLLIPFLDLLPSLFPYLAASVREKEDVINISVNL
jgi:hypothetical protein